LLTWIPADITLAEHPAYQIPILDFTGAPTGIDATKVVRTGLLPVVNTGIAGRVAGTGQVGAGLVKPPFEVFVAATRALGGGSPLSRGLASERSTRQRATERFSVSEDHVACLPGGSSRARGTGRRGRLR
jgi:hypothetical protein